MRVFIDSNVLISAIRFPHGVARQAYDTLILSNDQAMICKVNIDETRKVFSQKFPEYREILEAFLFVAKDNLTIVQTPPFPNTKEPMIRDVNDRVIFRAAATAKADVILTGDKDFLESGLEHPLCMTPAEYLLLRDSRHENL